jgi:hypothetical protein
MNPLSLTNKLTGFLQAQFNRRIVHIILDGVPILWGGSIVKAQVHIIIRQNEVDIEVA